MSSQTSPDEKHFDGSALTRNMSVTLTQAQFEELYLQPLKMTKQQASNVAAFGNPTLIGMLGFCCTFTPVCLSLMSFGSSSPSTMTAYVGVFYLFGGPICWTSAIGEFFLGNSFSMVTFAAFGSFWFIFGTLNDPKFGLAAALGGPTSPAFLDSIGMFICVFGIFCLFGTIAAIRTNIVFLAIFATITIAAEIIGAGYLQLSKDPVLAMTLLKTGGSIGFVTACLGWYFFAFLMLTIVDFPLRLPVGDLSQRIRGLSERNAA